MRREVPPVDGDDSGFDEPEPQITNSRGKKDVQGRHEKSKRTRSKAKTTMAMADMYKELQFSRTIKNGRMYIVDQNGKKDRKFPVKPEDSGPVMSFMTKWHDKGGGVAKGAPSLRDYLKNHKDSLALHRQRDAWEGLDM
jgi:hypothetical protein